MVINGVSCITLAHGIDPVARFINIFNKNATASQLLFAVIAFSEPIE
jgi:cadmium resistance protein CadD (predicted permease)